MRHLIRCIGILLAICLLLSATAFADMKRGDKNDDVYWLQELLIGTGWLFEEADGVFGRNTEQAVKNVQGYYGFEQTGIADDELIGLLTRDMALLDHQIAVQNFYIDGAGADGVGADELYCWTQVDEYGTPSTHYCAAHLNLLEQADELIMNDDAEAAAALLDHAVYALYTKWMDQTNDEEVIDAIKSASGAYAHAVDMQTELMKLWYGPYATQAPWQGRIQMLRGQLAFLCEIVNMQGQGGEN